MGYSLGALNLKKVPPGELPRLDDRISFLHVEHATVTQTRTGLVAWRSDGTNIEIPCGSLSALLLGPGTSITHDAATTLFRAGCVAIWTSHAGVSGYQSATPLTGSARWAQAQARMWADPAARHAAAVTLYRRRLPKEACAEGTPLRVMRGLEGRLVKTEYQRYSRLLNQPGWRRRIDSDDPVNQGLNLGNAILYGCALSVCSALAINPGLGVIHHGATGAFLYDLADVYKLDITIPAAFLSAHQPNPLAAMRRTVRSGISARKVIDNMFATTAELLSPHVQAASDDVLLDDDGNFVEGHRNWHLE